MSKKIIILIVVLALIGGGVGFWFLRTRGQGSGVSTNQEPGNTIPGAGSSDIQQINGGGGDAVEAPSISPVVQSASSTSTLQIPSGAVAKMLIVSGDAPHEPLFEYQGKVMTRTELEKAWSASSTNTGSSGAVKPTSPIQMDPASDKDHDGLSYSDEMSLGTDPNNADTDGDGLTDGQEAKAYKTDPKNFDTDSDGLTDGDEIKVHKTDPLKKDTDGDGFSDGMEVQSGYNPLGAGKLKK